MTSPRSTSPWAGRVVLNIPELVMPSAIPSLQLENSGLLRFLSSSLICSLISSAIFFRFIFSSRNSLTRFISICLSAFVYKLIRPQLYYYLFYHKSITKNIYLLLKIHLSKYIYIPFSVYYETVFTFHNVIDDRTSSKCRCSYS